MNEDANFQHDRLAIDQPSALTMGAILTSNAAPQFNMFVEISG